MNRLVLFIAILALIALGLMGGACTKKAPQADFTNACDFYNTTQDSIMVFVEYSSPFLLQPHGHVQIVDHVGSQQVFHCAFTAYDVSHFKSSFLCSGMVSWTNSIH